MDLVEKYKEEFDKMPEQYQKLQDAVNGKTTQIVWTNISKLFEPNPYFKYLYEKPSDQSVVLKTEPKNKKYKYKNYLYGEKIIKYIFYFESIENIECFYIYQEKNQIIKFQYRNRLKFKPEQIETFQFNDGLLINHHIFTPARFMNNEYFYENNILKEIVLGDLHILSKREYKRHVSVEYFPSGEIRNMYCSEHKQYFVHEGKRD